MRDLLVTKSASSVVTLSNLKAQHLRVTHSADDDYLTALIGVAERKFEAFTGRALLSQTWRLYFDRAPGARIVELPKAPLQSVTSVQYVDDDGQTQTFSSANYSVRATSNEAYAHARGCLRLNDDATWPTTEAGIDKFWVNYVAGWDSASKVPSDILIALYVHIADMYFHRVSSAKDAPTPETSLRLYEPFKLEGWA